MFVDNLFQFWEDEPLLADRLQLLKLTHTAYYLNVRCLAILVKNIATLKLQVRENTNDED